MVRIPVEECITCKMRADYNHKYPYRLIYCSYQEIWKHINCDLDSNGYVYDYIDCKANYYHD